jgi:hypothetical protein
MTAALGTLPFLATLWLLVTLGASVLEESGAKIAAALKGVPVQPRRLSGEARRSVRRPRRQRAPAQPQWRAAA